MLCSERDREPFMGSDGSGGVFQSQERYAWSVQGMYMTYKV